MAKLPISATELRAVVEGVPGAFAGIGDDKDVDAAFDDAVTAAGYDYGYADLLPSLTSADAATLTVAEPAADTLDRVLAAVAADLATIEPGRVYARPVAAPAAHRRRRVLVSVEDVDVDWPTTTGLIRTRWRDLPPALAAALRAALPAAPADDEVLERVEVRRHRARFKPTVTVHRLASASRHAVLTTDGRIVSDGHRTAGEARHAAVTYLKELPATDQAQTELQVLKLLGRAEGLPLMSVLRVRLVQKVGARVTFATEKDAAKTRIVGWVFYGRHATQGDADPAEAGRGEEQAGPTQE